MINEYTRNARRRIVLKTDDGRWLRDDGEGILEWWRDGKWVAHSHSWSISHW